ncbi:SRGN protein, partial [Thinocorus orbignyianus]|nr:SRGN protein [Thinocorus orbignyianus]
APMQKASDKRVRCQPDAWSTNCIKENQPWFSLPTGGANRILPPDPSPRKTQQDLNVIFPLSDEEPGSGSYAAMAVETGS